MGKIHRYIFCLVVGLLPFFSGIVSGSGSNCSSYPPCDDGQEFDDDCQCVSINSGDPESGTQNPSQNPELGDPESGSSNQGNLECNQEDCTNYGEIWSTGQCKCVCDSSVKCCGIQLNTVVPFIGDCIELDTDSSRGDTTSVNSVTAFPILMQGLMKILMSVIMVFSFIMVIVSGLMMTAGAFKSSSFDKGKSILKNVLISLILLGCSGLILSLINPSFFGG